MRKRLSPFIAICLSLILVSVTISNCSGAPAEADPEDFNSLYMKAIAPDGSGVLLYGAKDEWRMYDFYLMRSKTGADTKVFEQVDLPDDCEDISLSRGSDAILYRVDQKIYVANRESNAIDLITDKAGTDRTAPCFSPDGNSVLFLGADNHLYRTSLGSLENAVISSLDVRKFFVLGDGARILLQVNTDQKDELLVVNADGSNAEKIAVLDFVLYAYTFSSDGNSALMYSLERGDLAFVDLANNTVNPLPYDYTYLSEKPFQFTPDGDRILVCGTREKGSSGIYSMKTDGSDIRLLNDTPTLSYSVSLPDNKIVCLGIRDGTSELFTLNLDGSFDKVIPLSNFGFINEHALLFSADGSRIYYALDSGSIIEMRSDASLCQQVTYYVNPTIDKNNPPEGYTRGTDNCVDNG